MKKLECSAANMVPVLKPEVVERMADAGDGRPDDEIAWFRQHKNYLTDLKSRMLNKVELGS